MYKGKKKSTTLTRNRTLGVIFSLKCTLYQTFRFLRDFPVRFHSHSGSLKSLSIQISIGREIKGIPLV